MKLYLLLNLTKFSTKKTDKHTQPAWRWPGGLQSFSHSYYHLLANGITTTSSTACVKCVYKYQVHLLKQNSSTNNPDSSPVCFEYYVYKRIGCITKKIHTRFSLTSV